MGHGSKCIGESWAFPKSVKTTGFNLTMTKNVHRGNTAYRYVLLRVMYGVNISPLFCKKRLTATLS
jgi:hypothetical protein